MAVEYSQELRLSLNTFAVELKNDSSRFTDSAETIASAIHPDHIIRSVSYKSGGIVLEKTEAGVAETTASLAVSQIAITFAGLVARMYCNHGKLKIYKSRQDDCSDAIPSIQHLVTVLSKNMNKNITFGPPSKYMVNYCTHAGRHIDLDQLHLHCGATIVLYDVSDTNLKARVIFKHNDRQITCILFREGKINILRTSDTVTAEIAKEKIFSIVAPYLYTPPTSIAHTGQFSSITIGGVSRRIPVMEACAETLSMPTVSMPTLSTETLPVHAGHEMPAVPVSLPTATATMPETTTETTETETHASPVCSADS